MRLKPAEHVIQVFGSVHKTAKALGKNPSSISKWVSQNGPEKTRGLVPSWVQVEVMEIAGERGLDITYEDLIAGRVIE